MKQLDYCDSNKAQQYSTHPMFRYFGKLPPTLVSLLLDEYASNSSPILELMCGSGTCMVESYLRGVPVYGVDINPFSVMLSNVKTTKIPKESLDELLCRFESFSVSDRSGFDYYRPNTRNIDYWFTRESQEALSSIRFFIDTTDFSDLAPSEAAIKDFLRVSFAGIVRKVSNASERTGRIFHCDPDPSVDAISQMRDRLFRNAKMIESLPLASSEHQALVADARCLPFDSDTFGFVLNHPPYFALYKYSSDVLRFEMEWLGINRRTVAKGEIEDGFKTTNAALLDTYIDDMKEVFRSGARVMKPGATFCLVVSDSTLREEQLPVISRLEKAADEEELALFEHMTRPVNYAQASYHRSANPRIKTNQDHILLFRK